MSAATSQTPHVLLAGGPDRSGIVAAITGLIAQSGCSIIESHHFSDPDADRFYTRTVFVRPEGPALDVNSFRREFSPIAQQFDMVWSMHDLTERPRVLIAVSKIGHCLFDLLHRWRSGLLKVEIVGVVSNHEDMRSFVEWNGLPYHFLSVDKADKFAQESRFLTLCEALRVDLVVLARYMQILSPALCEALAGRCINIHHSFLPSFKGARPYHQAHARGVKLIGATAHFVTTDLDEGPIIEQGVERVSHAQSAEDLVTIGRDIECAVLARAVAWQAEHRLVRHGHRVVVFK
ncbi:MAG: formyltetrahydrofolate deformylase [Rhodospirillales bacterium 69-11]|nr:MAG: formyltetrahydrofolate deformylase [Rhodospirillales bacterium 69-11]